MPMTISYTPANPAGLAIMADAVREAEDVIARMILERANEGVPVREGFLRGTGRTGRDDRGAYITYGDDAPTSHGSTTNDYVLPQHERMDFNHPNGGYAKWLEIAMHSGNAEYVAAAHTIIAAAMGLL